MPARIISLLLRDTEVQALRACVEVADPSTADRPIEVDIAFDVIRRMEEALAAFKEV